MSRVGIDDSDPSNRLSDDEYRLLTIQCSALLSDPRFTCYGFSVNDLVRLRGILYRHSFYSVEALEQWIETSMRK